MIAQSSTEIVDSAINSGDLLRALAIVAGALVVAILANRLTRRVMARWVGAGFASLLTARLVAYALFVVGLFYAMSSLGVRVGPLLGALGLGGLVLALALQGVVENFVGAVILQTRRPFTVGDTVELGDHVVVVTDIDARTTALRGLDGTSIRIPNTVTVSNPIVNLTKQPVRRSTVEVGVAYDTNLDDAFEALREAVGRVRRILSEPAPMVVLRRFGASSIDWEIHYWHSSDVPSELLARHDLLRSVHESLASVGVTIAFPQVVVWSGRSADDDELYAGDPEEIHTTHEGHAAPSPVERRPLWSRRSRNRTSE